MDESINEQATDVYAVVEMMGHRKVVGIISESRFGPGSLIRCDVIDGHGKIDRTEHIGVGSVYCLTEVSKEAAEMSARAYVEKPSFAYTVPQAPRTLPGMNDDDDFDDRY